MSDSKRVAAIYARQSKEVNKGDSIGNQVERCVNYCKAFNWNEYEVYEDEGFSGKDGKRPEFERMLSDVRANRIHTIVVYKLDRIMRNLDQFTTLVTNLNALDVSFISLSESFDPSTPMGAAMMNITATFAQLEREQISLRVSDNMYDLFVRGRWVTGRPPFGYVGERVRDDNGKFMTLPTPDSHADTIRLIFDLYNRPGNSLVTVSRYLSLKDIQTPNGKSFTPGMVSEYLSNFAYCQADENAYDFFKDKVKIPDVAVSRFTGNVALQRYGKEDANRKKRPMLDWTVVPGSHKWIVDSDTFINAFQKKKKQKKWSEEFGIRRGTSFRSPLTGLVICDKCKHHMNVRGSNKPSKTGNNYLYFYCPERYAKCTCIQNNIDALALERFVASYIVDVSSNYEKLLQLVNSQLEVIQRASSKLTFNTDAAEKRLKDIDSELSMLIELALDGTLSKNTISLKERKLLSEKKDLQERISSAIRFSNSVLKTKINAYELNKALSDFKELSSDAIGFDRKRELFRSIIKEIHVDGNDVNVVLYFDISTFFPTKEQKVAFLSVLKGAELSHLQYGQVFLTDKSTLNNKEDLIEVKRKIAAELSAKLKAWRSDKSYSLNQASEFLNIGKSNLCNWEHCRYFPAEIFWLTIKDIFNIDIQKAINK